MKEVIVVVAWFLAVGFVTWMLYDHGHYVWAGVVAIIGALRWMIQDRVVKEQ